MSSPSIFSTSNGITPGQVGRYVVPAQAIQSAISTHQRKSAVIDKVPHGDELFELEMELHAAYSAYASGQISGAEWDATHARIAEASNAHQRRTADFDRRTQAGQTQPSDFFKEFYGCTDEEAQDLLRYGSNTAKIHNANEARSHSRMLQQSRCGRGH